MAEKIKTQPTDTPFEAHVAKVDPARQADFHTLADLLREVSGKAPVVWSNGIVGFGSFTYQCSNKVENEWMVLGLASRKDAFTVTAPFHKVENLPEKLASLGKHKMGVGCLYVKKLDDIDLPVLRQILVESCR